MGKFIIVGGFVLLICVGMFVQKTCVTSTNPVKSLVVREINAKLFEISNGKHTHMINKNEIVTIEIKEYGFNTVFIGIKLQNQSNQTELIVSANNAQEIKQAIYSVMKN